MLDRLFYYQAKVSRVVDGDTFIATIDLGFKTSLTVRCRLANLNAEELSSQTPEKAIKAQTLLTELILGKTVMIRSKKVDKYGRCLVTVFVDTGTNWLNVNEYLITNDLAVGLP